MNELQEVVKIDGQDYSLPEGVQPLTDDGLYVVDFNMIKLAEEYKEGDENIKFFNPRHLGSCVIDVDGKEEKYRGQGFEKEEMHELMEKIQHKGLNYPLLGFWEVKDGELKFVRVNDGERRYRCIQRMIEKNEKAYSLVHKKFMPAKEVFSTVLCRVKAMTDEEALQEACEVSGTAVPWGPAAQARLIKILYDHGKSDEEVCKILKKKPQWIAETYSLNGLDEFTFGYLVGGKINRTVALRLLKIADIEERKATLTACWQEAVKRNESVKEKLKESVDKAVAKVELTESQLLESTIKGEEEEVIDDIKEELKEAQENLQVKEETLANAPKPIIKSKDANRASNNRGKKPSRCLRGPKIQKHLNSLNELVEKSDESVLDLDTLNVLISCYKAILEGETDIIKVLKSL